MGIVDDDIQALRAATDIVAVITKYTQLRRSGQRWVGLCPFHGEKSPSFSVNQAEGLYYCFGCRVSGDAITFLRELEGLGYNLKVLWTVSATAYEIRRKVLADITARVKHSAKLGD